MESLKRRVERKNSSVGLEVEETDRCQQRTRGQVEEGLGEQKDGNRGLERIHSLNAIEVGSPRF